MDVNNVENGQAEVDVHYAILYIFFINYLSVFGLCIIIVRYKKNNTSNINRTYRVYPPPKKNAPFRILNPKPENDKLGVKFDFSVGQ